MDMNPFAELQQYQLGSSLMGQPQASGPAVQPAVPALPMGGMPSAAQAAPQADLQQRTAGWRSALDELSASPVAAIMLLQMGTALSGGRKFPDALQMGLGAAGRAGAIQNQYEGQQATRQQAERRTTLEEQRLGLDERRLTAQEKLWEAQLQAQQARARGGGGGGGGGGSTGGLGRLSGLKTANIKVGTSTIPVFYGMSIDDQGRPKAVVYDVAGNQITDPKAINELFSQVETQSSMGLDRETALAIYQQGPPDSKKDPSGWRDYQEARKALGLSFESRESTGKAMLEGIRQAGGLKDNTEPSKPAPPAAPVPPAYEVKPPPPVDPNAINSLTDMWNYMNAPGTGLYPSPWTGANLNRPK